MTKYKFKIIVLLIMTITIVNATDFSIDDLFKQIETYRNPKTDGPQNVIGSIIINDCKDQTRGYYENKNENKKITPNINDSIYAIYKKYIDTALLYKNVQPDLSIEFHNKLADNIFDNRFFSNSYDTIPFDEYLQLYCDDKIVIAPYKFPHYGGSFYDDSLIAIEIYKLLYNIKKPTKQEINKLIKIIDESNNDEVWKLRRLLHVEYFNFVNNKDLLIYNHVLHTVKNHLYLNKNLENNPFISVLYSELSKGFLKAGDKANGLKYSLYSKTDLIEKRNMGIVPYKFEYDYYNNTYNYYTNYVPYNKVILDNLLDKYYEVGLSPFVYPEYKYYYDTTNWAFQNSSFIFQYLCLEYTKIANATNIIEADKKKILTYLIYKLHKEYVSLLNVDSDHRLVSATYKADATSKFAHFIDKYNPSNKFAILKYRQDAAMLMTKEEDNPFPYNNHLNYYVSLLQDNGYYNQARVLIEIASMTCINNPDYSIIGATQYPLFRNYLLQNKYDSASYILNLTDRILNDTLLNFNKSTFGYSYNKQMYDWAVLQKDTITMERFKPYINNNYIPIEEFDEIVNIEAQVKEAYHTKKIQLKNDSLQKANTKLNDAIIALEKAKQNAEANEKEAKRQESIAVEQRDLANNRLDTISLKEDSLRLERDSILELNKQLIADTVALYNNNIDLEEANKKVLRNRNFIIGLVSLVSLLLILFLLWMFKSRNESLQLRVKNNLKFLKYHNLKGLTDSLAIIDTDLDRTKILLEKTNEYVQSLFKNIKMDFISLEDEITMMDDFVDMYGYSDNVKYKFIYDINDSYRNISIPPGILQPLIENSIKYGGLKQMEGKGEIKLEIERFGNEIKLKLYDNGNGVLNVSYIQKKGHSLDTLSELLKDYSKMKSSKFKYIFTPFYENSGQTKVINIITLINK